MTTPNLNSPNLKSPRRARSVLTKMSTLVLCFLASVFLQGCGKSDSEPDQTGDTIEDDVAVISLDATFAGLLPEEFEINVPRDLPTSEINAWGKVMLSDMLDQEVDEAGLSEALAKVLPDATVARVLRSQYVLRDSTHLRDSLWARELMQSVIRKSKTNTDQLVDLFYSVVTTIRNVPDEQSLPFGPFEMVKHGQGTAEDRAWAFATLLRQQRVPTVVFVDNESVGKELADNDQSATESRKNLIVGALLDDALYLFDIGLGQPIPGPDDDGSTVLIRQPATLGQVLDDPTLLSKLSGGDDSSYAVSVEQLKSLQPQVIGDSTLWARRMEGLQIGLPGEIKVSIFDPLVSYGVYEGVLDQVSSHMAKVYPDSKVGVWGYPEQQRELREAVAGDQEKAKLLVRLSETFKVPQPMTVYADSGQPIKNADQLTIEFGSSWGTHQNGRINQITGRPEKAIPAYLKVQSWRTLPPSPKDASSFDRDLEPLILQRLPKDVRLRHLLAAEEALVWRATCQLQKKDYKSAAAALEGYLRQLAGRVYPGRFRSEANFLTGVSLGLAGNSRRGMAFLRNVDVKSGRYDVSQSLIRRWTAQAENVDK